MFVFPHMLPHFPLNVDYGESRHLCDDPGCPDPVQKLSTGSVRQTGRTNLQINRLFLKVLGTVFIHLSLVLFFFLEMETLES